MKKPHNKYRFPWQTDNHFELLIDGPVFFPTMLDAISQAEHYILLEMYLVSPGTVSQRFITALCEAANRGVSVYILLDAYGSRSLNTFILNKITNCGINLCFYNPLQLNNHQLMLFRDHRKLLVIDGQTAFVGGAGLIDEFDSAKSPQLNWRENMVKIQGSNVLQWQLLFTDNWGHWSTESISLKQTAPDSTDYDQYGRVTMTSGPRLLEIKRSFINHVRNAKQHVWMSTAYFTPSGKLRRSLCRSARNGIDVRLLIPGPITDHPMARYLAQSHYSRLLRHGVRIFEYQPRFMHAKLVLCDNWVSLGSCNIDRWNLRWNLDANQEINDATFTASVIQMFENDFSQSIEIILDDWKKRSWKNKIRIFFWAKILRLTDIILTRLKIIRQWEKLQYRKSKAKK
ncbi:MAG: phospholipase D-like domain-containing protein [Gammaproteobacteria bacterium]|nr:phospholipase D-like domain-containing protein [Gammaproteobacteria bacterium]